MSFVIPPCLAKPAKAGHNRRMQRPSIAGSVILSIFGLPFAATGLLLAATAVRNQSGAPSPWVGAVIGIAVACMGFLLLAGAVVVYRSSKHLYDLKRANPDRPWLWKDDWAASRANGSNSKVNIAIWVVAGPWDAVSFAPTIANLPQILAHQDRAVMIMMVFPLIGVLLTFFAVRGTMRTLRYGHTRFWFDSPVFSPGSHIKGAIHLKLSTDVPHGFDLTLACKRRLTTGTGNTQSTQEFVLWQDSQNVPAGLIARGPAEAQVPVDFALPPDALQTDEDNYRDRVFWQLQAKADATDINFNDKYEIPVFGLVSDSGPETAVSATSQFSADPSQLASAQTFPAPPQTKIVCRQDATGPSFYFPAFRRPGSALVVLLVLALWSGIVYVLWRDPHAPMLFRVVFSAFEVVVIYLFLNAFFGSSLLRVRDGALEAKNAILGLGSLRRIPFPEISSVSPLSQTQTTASGEMMYGILIRRKDGAETKIAANSVTRAEANWIVTTIDQAMGRTPDIKVEYQSLSGPPPQRTFAAQASGARDPKD